MSEPMTEAEQAAREVIWFRLDGREWTKSNYDGVARAVVAAVRPILADEIEALAAELRSGFPKGPGPDTASYISGIKTAAGLVRGSRTTTSEETR